MSQKPSRIESRCPLVATCNLLEKTEDFPVHTIKIALDCIIGEAKTSMRLGLAPDWLLRLAALAPCRLGMISTEKAIAYVVAIEIG